jgi:hypothetical protein
MKRSALSIFVLLVLVPAVSRAADPLEDFPDPGAAQTLYQEARALIQKNKYSEACPKLEDSLRLEAGVGTRSDLADCNEHIGKIATAWAGFLDAAARSSKVASQADREKLARRRAQALEPRLPKLLIEVPKAMQGLEVKRDGVAIDAAAWGTPIPVDPGAHRVIVTAPGRTRWVTTVQIKEGETVRVEVPRDFPARPDTPRDPATSLDIEPEMPRDPATSFDFETPDATPGPAAGAFQVGGLVFAFR